MTTIKSLKDMYVKLGGSLTDTYADIAGGKAVGTYATIPEMIQACTKKAGSGGGGGGGEEPFYVKFTITNPETFEVGSADKTFAEVSAADEAGKRIVGKFVATIDGQDMEIFEADVAARMFAEHGNAYIWQYIDKETLMLVYYDVEGINSSVSPWSDIINNRYVVEFSQVGTAWQSNRSIQSIYEAWMGGMDVVGISGGIVLQLIGISETEAAFNVTVTAGTKLAYSQFRQYIDGNDQEVVEVIEKSIVVE